MASPIPRVQHVLAALFLLLAFAPAAQAQQTAELQLLGRFGTGIFDEGAAEIVVHHPGTQRLFFTNADANSVFILDISNPASPVKVGEIDMSPYGDGVNSVAVNAAGIVAIASEAAAVDANGQVVFFDTNGAFLNNVTAGVLPDMVTFTPDGMKVLSANEGEPNDDYNVDPEGSITIIDISGGVANASAQQITFTDFNAGASRAAELPSDVRIFGPGASVAQDLEPEYIAINPAGTKAYVACQENNALVVVDIATAQIDTILALGFKDHSLPGNELDASNRDGSINIANWPVLGMYQPDAIATYEVGGQVYIVSANEGDARDYDGFSEEERIGDFMLDPTAFPNAADLLDNANLGRLRTTSANGDTDGDGDYDVLYSYGARSFTIWNATTGAIVFDSGSDFETRLAALIPNDFNSNNDENDSFDSRSDDKGPEPEAVTIGQIGGRHYAFIGLERVGGVMVYDVTNPVAPVYQTYLNNRDFSVADVEADLAQVGDMGPESIAFISASDSPNGQNLIAVSNEVSGTVSIFQVNAPFSLAILHNNDGESQLLNLGGGETDFGGVARFKTVVDNLRSEAATNNQGAILLSSGDNFLAGPEFNASFTSGTFFDAIALDALDYDAIALGNHDFDFGPDVLADFMADFTDNTPYVSANLDFSNEARLQAFVDSGRLAKSVIVDEGGQKLGVIGATTTNLPFISAPRNVNVLQDVASSVQAEIDALTAQGINKIILISHLQGIDEDIALAAQLRGVDVMIAGGGDELLANAGDLLVPGDEGDVFGAYPLLATNADGAQVPVVTTTGSYAYVGRLIVDFDNAGNLTSISDDSGPVRVAGGSNSDAVQPDADLQTRVVDPVQAAVDALAANVIASSEVALDGVRGNVRSIETNEGNLIADAMLWQARALAPSFGVGMPTVALQNGGGIRNNNVYAAGDITELNTFDMLPFGNLVSVVENISPVQFKWIMENAVSRVGSGSGTGRFAQMSGMRMRWDPNGTAQQISGSTITTSGTRVQEIRLDDGTYIVRGGQVVDGAPNINVVVGDFLARGGDQYPFFGAPFTPLGVTGQQALAAYLAGPLGGTIRASAYPEGGELRNFEVDPIADYPATADVPRRTSIFEQNGVQVYNGGFGSAMAADPFEEGVFYMLTDRGPNFNGATSGTKVFPVPSFTPQLTRVQMVGNEMREIGFVTLKDANGNPISGLPNPEGLGSTGETPIDLNGTQLATDPEGIDTEGLVVMPDGSFWVSDEYGPHLVHFAGNGRTIERINPFGSGTGGRRLPAVFANRRANRGMEGLTITPDGKTLVGIMQTAMYNPFADRGNIRANAKQTRILFFDIASGETKQYLYMQDAPNRSNSAILALNDTQFLVLERDGGFGTDPGAVKRIYKIDITGATDVSDPNDGALGMQVGSQTLEQLTEEELFAAGIRPVQKALVVDLLQAIPGYDHDKPEGIALIGTDQLAIINDDDFGITSDGNGGIVQKRLPSTGEVDRNRLYIIPIPDVNTIDTTPAFTLTILHNNDGESKLLGLTGDQEGFGGAAHFTRVVQDLKAGALRPDGTPNKRGVVMLSSGDNFLPGPEFNASLSDGVYYDARVLEAIGYDAIAIGNHDFDFGPDILADFIGSFTSSTPYLSANLDYAQEPGLQGLFDAGRIARSTVVIENGEPIGIIGATTPNLDFISSPRNVVVSDDVAGAVQAEIDALTAQGVNKIILISHLQGIDEDLALAEQLSGIDVMIAGGGDELLANNGSRLVRGDGDEVFATYPIMATSADGTDVPVVTTTGQYAYVGRLVVTFDDQGSLQSISDESGPVRVAQRQNAAINFTDAVDADPMVFAEVITPVQTSVDALEANILATTEVALNGVRGNVRSRETNQGNLIADAMLWQARERAASFGAAQPDVAIQNGGGIRNDSVIPAGSNLSELTTFQILPFGNFLSVVEDIPAAQFKEIMENAVSRVQGGGGTGRFAQIAGFTIAYNPAGTAQQLDDDGNVSTPGNRIIAITLDDGTQIVSRGNVVGGAPDVNIAIGNFLARGGDQYPFRGAPFTQLGVTDQQTLANYISTALGGVVSVVAVSLKNEGRIIETTTVDTENAFADLPQTHELAQNYPNPFNPSTTIRFALPQAEQVRLAVYDMLGRELAVLVDGQRPAGWHSATFDARDLASGMYLYRLEAGAQVITQQMVLVK